MVSEVLVVLRQEAKVSGVRHVVWMREEGKGRVMVERERERERERE